MRVELSVASTLCILLCMPTLKCMSMLTAWVTCIVCARAMPWYSMHFLFSCYLVWTFSRIDLVQCMHVIIHLARLETRIKESNTCASLLVIRWGVRKVTARMCALSANWPIVRGLCLSICIRTRKMVNYAWIMQIQEKFWRKLAAVLTCKSFVKFEYRGERLIEPSSSWFLLKFPSG